MVLVLYVFVFRVWFIKFIKDKLMLLEYGFLKIKYDLYNIIIMFFLYIG